jgi:hypothetical protein
MVVMAVESTETLLGHIGRFLATTHGLNGRILTNSKWSEVGWVRGLCTLTQFDNISNVHRSIGHGLYGIIGCARPCAINMKCFAFVYYGYMSVVTGNNGAIIDNGEGRC